MMGEHHDWDRVLGLYAKLEQKEAIELDVDVRDLCRRVARDVAISHDDAERALLTPEGAETLVREMRRRIFEGSRRLSRALVDSARRKNAGDVAGARTVLEGVLTVEVVPLYRDQAQIALDYVDEPEDWRPAAPWRRADTPRNLSESWRALLGDVEGIAACARWELPFMPG